MKKTCIIALSVVLVVLCVFCLVANQSNNEPSKAITAETAIKTARNILDKKSKETIISLDNPKVEEVVFDSEHYMLYFDENDKLSQKPFYKIQGKTLYQITFNTTQDGLLGPIVVYVDKSNGKLIGVDFRY